MRNKPTLVFFTFLFTFCFTLSINAQQQKKKKNNAFDLEIIKYSDKPNSQLEHTYSLLLKNNSNETADYSLSTKNKKCRDNDHAHKKGGKNKSNNLTSELFIQNLGKKYNPKNNITLNAKESIMIYLKVKQSSNIEHGKWDCTVVKVKFGKDKSPENNKNVKSVTIESYSTDLNTPGH